MEIIIRGPRAIGKSAVAITIENELRKIGYVSICRTDAPSPFMRGKALEDPDFVLITEQTVT